MTAIALIGLSGSGKSTVGPLLAERLGVPHHDVDLDLERRDGRTIRQIFDTDGEPHFRALERDLTLELLAGDGVVSLGGGAPMTPQVAEALAQHPVVWLRVEPESAAERIGRDENRPLLSGQDVEGRLRRMLSERGPTYAALASLAVDTDFADVASVVTAIAAHVSDFAAGGYVGEVVPVTADKPYEVRVGRGVSFELGEALGQRDRVALFHPKVMTKAAEALAASLESDVTLIEVPDGEKAKRAKVLAAAWTILADNRFTRTDAVVGLGGGSTTDFAGFVAATWMRGVDYVSVPTTLLAMVDAAVGGKTGINLPEGKNLVGAFWEPVAVLCDMDHLATLPVDDLRGGMAEMVKHGFIADHRTLQLFETCTEAMFDPRSPELAEGIARSIRIKANVVSADLRESTSHGRRIGRELLNYGHTLGHAIERHAGYRMSHGECVSVGMNYAATLSRRLGIAEPALVDRHRAVLEKLGLPTRYDKAAWPALRDSMNLDKKARGAALRFVLLEDVARARIEVAPPEGVLKAAYAEIAR